MRFGVCCGPDMAATVAGAGYEYFEWSVGGLLKPREGEDAFREALRQVRVAPIPCPAVNCFIPGDLKLTGPEVNREAVDAYVATACRRAAEAGVERIVFGSGGARKIPEGFDRAKAHEQLVEFCGSAAEAARAAGVVIVIEPLNRRETNVINSVAEGAALVRLVDDPNLRLLVDGYHWAVEREPAEDIVRNARLLAHAHVATTANRMAPGAEECDLGPFFRALREGGYAGRVSIEGRIPNPAADLPRALALMKSLAGVK